MKIVDVTQVLNTLQDHIDSFDVDSLEYSALQSLKISFMSKLEIKEVNLWQSDCAYYENGNCAKDEACSCRRSDMFNAMIAT